MTGAATPEVGVPRPSKHVPTEGRTPESLNHPINHRLSVMPPGSRQARPALDEARTTRTIKANVG